MEDLHPTCQQEEQTQSTQKHKTDMQPLKKLQQNRINLLCIQVIQFPYQHYKEFFMGK
jgi:hypothetical protein